MEERGPSGRVEPVDISVVIPAYFGSRTIGDCVASVLRATDGRKRQIIVVESSGDGTAGLLRQRYPEVTVIESPSRLSAGGARNRGAREAAGQLVFFADQDCIVPPDWVDRLESYFTDPAIGAAGGSVGIANPSNLSGCAVYFLEFLYHFPNRGRPKRDGNFMVGCNSVYRKAALDVTRFPDQTLGEDILFSNDLERNGFATMYDPQVEVRHHNREGWGEFFEYNRKMGRSAAAYHLILRRWWARPFLRIPALTYLSPLVILPSIALDLIRSRWSYFFRFVLLSPVCLAGNLVWASAFRRQVRDSRRSGPAAK